jgi:ribonuclease HI
VAVLHLDESCLGNGRPGENPGGAGGLVEIRMPNGITRRDFHLHAPGTTNNRMALAGAIAALQLLGQKGRRLRLLVISDSEYLVKGVREWAPAWQRRGWTRKGGAIENLALWQALWHSLDRHEVQFTWVRGHAGHPKNEYANDLAVAAARDQVTSDGLVASGFAEWLAPQQARGKFPGYDPDAAFDALAARVAAGERIPLAEGT